MVYVDRVNFYVIIQKVLPLNPGFLHTSCVWTLEGLKEDGLVSKWSDLHLWNTVLFICSSFLSEMDE